MARLDRWNEPHRILTVMEGGALSPAAETVQEHWEKLADTGEPKQGLKGATTHDLIKAARELVFEMRNGLPYFTIVIYSLHSSRLEIQAVPALEILPPSDHSPESLSDHVRNVLAMAAIEEVPVYPNTDADEPDLLRYHREMLVDGFTAPGESGETVRLMLTQSPGTEIDSVTYIERVSSGRWFSPADVGLIRNVVLRELRQREEAGRILALLRLAIEDLSGCLSAVDRNEAQLQRCLTQNPILFGVEYVRLIPKHQLGAEFEMDYALERASGIVDLVEIEASTHSLFTAGGNPTQYLVHAEQQVLDWVDWIERHGEYARSALPGLMSPVGYVVIGRSTDLGEEGRRKLTRRNLMFRGQLSILTYDDLLARARGLLDRLAGAPTGSE